MSSAAGPGEPAPARGGADTYAGPVHWEYSPELDRDADPGEVVWAWVAFEDDHSVGKDRPIVVAGRTDDDRLVALMLSSRGHDGDPRWLAIGSGAWDSEGRRSWVRRDRILAVAPSAVRREGAILPRPIYDEIVRGLKSRASRASGPGLLGRFRRIFGRGH